MASYDAYLPHIEAEEGIKRVMNNKKLYITMLGRFKLQKMTEDLVKATESGDIEAIGFAAHALKGTAGNLGFPTMQKLTGDMETRAKNGEDIVPMIAELEQLTKDVAAMIQQFIATEG
ncbi:MAG: Hpt domain-containing protein [Defluviitaleaceae bacterium]|nr:Hpt domain-containing protein [Defluviitaleaceae bacterium]MCL2239768.1 Hpt domain-containing protein [Defluviitaleaceae bacterium]